MKLPLNDKRFLFLLAAVLLSVGLEVFSISGIDVPMPYAPVIYAAFIIMIGYGVLWEGVKALFRLDFSSINLLMLIAVCAAFYLGQYPEAAVVIVLYVLGEKLEDIGMEQSMSALNNLTETAPKTATVKQGEQAVPVEEIPVGTVIIVRPHDMIPLDGIVVAGETLVDESSITGEPLSKEKHKGDTVFAGTLNQKGFIEVRSTQTATDSTFAKIVSLTYEAQEHRSEAQKFIQKFAKIYTPIIIALALLIFMVPVFILGKDLNHWLNQAITLLVISCPCALVISTPVAVYAAIGNAFSKGALVKGGKYLETLAGIKAIALDKTRTITYGKPIVCDIIPLNGSSKEELLACSAGTEMFSEHPLADAIVEAAKKEGFTPHTVKQFESVVGHGAMARCEICDNQQVLVGRLDFIDQSNPVSEELKERASHLAQEGKTCVVVSCGNNIRGIIALTDQIKPDSAETVSQLKSLNIIPVMLTGDSRKAAEYVAAQVGIQEVSAELLPQEKMSAIQSMRELYGNIAMVGDGVNDAPALASANVGISMGAAGSDAAIEISDIAIMNDHLALVPFLIQLSRKMARTIRQNTVGAISIKILFILLAFLGYGNMVMAIAADVGVTLIVILISLRLSRVSFQEGA